eukprot:10728501-Karenia_brevis.AAC.1
MASSAVQALLLAAEADRSGDQDYREFVAWICRGSDVAVRHGVWTRYKGNACRMATVVEEL